MILKNRVQMYMYMKTLKLCNVHVQNFLQISTFYVQMYKHVQIYNQNIHAVLRCLQVKFSQNFEKFKKIITIFNNGANHGFKDI